MSNLHIYTTNAQPFTRWRIGTDILPKNSKWFVNDPRRQSWCDSCFRTRWAKNLEIRCYYDHTSVTCAGKCAPSNYRERMARRRKLARKAKVHP